MNRRDTMKIRIEIDTDRFEGSHVPTQAAQSLERVQNILKVSGDRDLQKLSGELTDGYDAIVGHWEVTE